MRRLLPLIFLRHGFQPSDWGWTRPVPFTDVVSLQSFYHDMLPHLPTTGMILHRQ